MKNIKKRFIGVVLLVAMVFSNLQVQTIFAMNDATALIDETKREVETSIENRLNYILVESPYLESPDTQNIVVSWGDGTEKIQSMELTVQKENGMLENWECSNRAEYLYVFSKTFSDGGEQSTYKVVDIRVEKNGKEQRFRLSDLKVEAEFGVNKRYNGIEELQPLSPENTSEVETSVVSIGENGEMQAQDNIVAALNAVSEDNGDSVKVRNVEKAGEIVVALDPGHDNSHGGTSGYGLTEQGLTLKIANYAKAELESYNGVKVYMTRTTANCPYPGTSTGGCIKQRVQAAAKAGAKIYVSFHLNSGPANANGAEVIIPNNSWKPQVAVQGKELAEKILNELAAVGLNKRPTPIYSKDTTVNEKYPDGSKSDYFSVQIYTKEAGIPGITVEHAFLSNASDVNSFLKTETGLKKLGVADATGIAKYLGLSKGQWIQVGDKWKYLTNGKYVVNQWLSIGEQRYYFDKNGYRVTGWQTIGGQTYYFMPDGHMHTGWLSFGSSYYYMMPDGHMHRGWLSFGNTYYYLNSEGVRVTGWQTIDGQKYYFMSDGTRYNNGWLSFGSTYYYMMPDGHMHTGWLEVKGKRYYMMPDGHRHTGWLSFGSTYYYMMPDGHMHTGWLSFGNTYYYLNSEGIRVTGWHTIQGKEYYFDENGIRKDDVKKSGWQTINGKKYYLDQNGKYVTGWLLIDRKKYYFMPDGHMHTGWLSFGSTYYYMMPDGHMHRGWLSFGNTYYYLNSEGVRVTGWHMIEGKEYYFDENGIRKDDVKKSGWQTINGKKYYLDQNGKYVIGWLAIDGKTYYFMPDGHMHRGWLSFGDTYYYMMPDGHMHRGWLSFGSTYYYMMPEGYMHRGWLSFGNTYYYMNSEGVRVTGWQTIQEQRYYFMPDGTRYSSGWLSFGNTYYYMMPDGHMHRGWLSFGSTYYYLNGDGVRVTGWQTIDGEQYYFDKNGIRQEGYLIEGTSSVTANSLIMYFKRKNVIYPAYYKNSDAPTIEKFCQIYVEEAKAENIKVEVAFMQAMLETGWLKFSGTVEISQYNFAGIGALDGGVKGASFSSVREGVRAQIQHLKAYANKEPLKNQQVDPRFHLVKRGTAKYVEWLGQQENPSGYGWATGSEYGNKILKLIKEL